MTDEFIPPTTFPARYRMRGGGIATIIAYSRMRFVGHKGHNNYVSSWQEDGTDDSASQLNLIGAPLLEKREPETVSLWAVEYPNGDLGTFHREQVPARRYGSALPYVEIRVPVIRYD